MSATTATTKERILEAAEEIMLAKSFHSVGLNEILSRILADHGADSGTIHMMDPDGMLHLRAASAGMPSK